MKFTNKNIEKIANEVFATAVYSSSLEEKACKYISSNFEITKETIEKNIDEIKKLLKKGDGLIHAIYESCANIEDKYIEMYNFTTIESIQKDFLKKGQLLKKEFKNDSDNSGFFDCKVAYVAQQAFCEKNDEVLSIGNVTTNEEDY